MITHKVNGKIHIINTIKLNLPALRRTRSAKETRRAILQANKIKSI